MPVARAAIAEALGLGATQFRLLQVRDFDGYAAGLDAYEAACLVVTSAGPDQADPRMLEELVRLDSSIAAELQRAKDELAARMAAMRDGRRASGAYFAQAAMPRAPLGEA